MLRSQVDKLKKLETRPKEIIHHPLVQRSLTDVDCDLLPDTKVDAVATAPMADYSPPNKAIHQLKSQLQQLQAADKKSATKKRQPIRAGLDYAIRVCLYAIITFFFSIYIHCRIALHAVIYRVRSIGKYHYRTTELISKDVSSFAKIPEHLSVMLRLNLADDKATNLQRLVDEAGELTAWCASAGITTLSIYEKTGLLKANMPQIHEAIQLTLKRYFRKVPALHLRAPGMPAYSPPSSPPSQLLQPSASTTSLASNTPSGGNDSKSSGSLTSRKPSSTDSLSGKPSTGSVSTPSKPAAAAAAGTRAAATQINVVLISEVDGRQTLVDLAMTLSEMSQHRPGEAEAGPKLNPKDITEKLIHKELCDAVMPDPDLLVLFGERVILDGYPPWQLRLTEIYHEQDHAESVSYTLFLSALAKYAGAEMRYGR